MLALRNSFVKLLDTLSLPSFNEKVLPVGVGGITQRFKFNEIHFTKPKPGQGYYRRVVQYPEKYTLKPLPYRNLAGRDPVSGRVVVGTLGGGIKHPLLWVDYLRKVEPGGPNPLIERVLEVMPEPTRSAHVALVGGGARLRYIIATANMKPGDLIKTSDELTRIAVRPNEGDAYPLGSLSVGTEVCCVEGAPATGAFFARAAGSSCTIVRKVGDKVVLLMATKREFSLPQTCLAVVGQVSNAIHSSVHIGSPNNLRAMGFRPRSGWWQRKTGKHGRKFRRPKPLLDWDKSKLPQKSEQIRLTLPEYPYHLP